MTARGKISFIPIREKLSEPNWRQPVHPTDPSGYRGFRVVSNRRGFENQEIEQQHGRRTIRVVSEAVS